MYLPEVPASPSWARLGREPEQCARGGRVGLLPPPRIGPGASRGVCRVYTVSAGPGAIEPLQAALFGDKCAVGSCAEP